VHPVLHLSFNPCQSIRASSRPLVNQSILCIQSSIYPSIHLSVNPCIQSVVHLFFNPSVNPCIQ
jgi:hypothetical protein